MSRHSLPRRTFLATAAATAVSSSLAPAATTEWGSPVLDIHFHWRADLRSEKDANLVHMDGAGVEKVILLTRDASLEPARAVMAKYPSRFALSVSTDITKPAAEQILRSAAKAGAVGIGEIKFHVDADGPEMRRAYAIAGDLDIPILVHFQEVDHFPGEGKWNSGFKRFAKVLADFPRTTFVGHADAFWANISADYHEEAAYPATPVKPGGITDKLLADYPNLFGDLSANSGNNGLSRSPDFTKDFLARHQDKLLFGGDCACSDGHGAGVSQQNNPTAARMAGKCVVRETLTLLKKQTTPEVFRKLTWANAHRVYRLKA